MASLPIHVARAYGAASVARVAPPPKPAPPQAPPAVKPLVAAVVRRAVDFEPEARPASAPTDTHRLYTRAADMVEAAVAVSVGQTIDIKA